MSIGTPQINIATENRANIVAAIRMEEMLWENDPKNSRMTTIAQKSDRIDRVMTAGIKIALILLEKTNPLTKWRKRRDSNPRYPFRYASFQDWSHQPLGHSSFLKFSMRRRVAQKGIVFERVFCFFRKKICWVVEWGNFELLLGFLRGLGKKWLDVDGFLW